MRVVYVGAEDEPRRQAHHPIRSRVAPIPSFAIDQKSAIGGLGLVQRPPKRGHEAEQRRRLVGDLVYERGADSVACDSLAPNTHDRDRVLAAEEPLRARWTAAPSPRWR